MTQVLAYGLLAASVLTAVGVWALAPLTLLCLHGGRALAWDVIEVLDARELDPLRDTAASEPASKSRSLHIGALAMSGLLGKEVWWAVAHARQMCGTGQLCCTTDRERRNPDPPHIYLA